MKVFAEKLETGFVAAMGAALFLLMMAALILRG
jgi:hypothetical protein